MFCVTLPCLARTFIHFWTNLDQPINSVHPVASSCFLLFLYFRFSGYLKCSEKSGKIILKISVTEPSRVTKRGKGGHHQRPGGSLARPHPRPRQEASWLPGGSPRHPPFAYIYPSG